MTEKKQTQAAALLPKKNVYDVIQARADKIGLSIRQLCELAGIDKDTFMSGKKEEPKTVKNLRKLEQILLKKEKEFSRNNPN